MAEQIKKNQTEVASNILSGNATSGNATSGNATSGKPMKRNWEMERQRDAKMVRGRFEYHESPGSEFFFSYHAYEGDPVVDYLIKDGEVRYLPYGVAKHLNNIGYPVHKYEQDPEGKAVMKVGKFTKRCSFVPLDFMPEDDFGSAPRLYTAEIEPGIIKL